MSNPMKPENIAPMLHWIRHEEIMLDRDLAGLYGVETRALKQAVRRNTERFPSDFMFELVDTEVDNMVSQNVIPHRGVFGGAAPMAFTELFAVVYDAIKQLLAGDSARKTTPKRRIGFHPWT